MADALGDAGLATDADAMYVAAQKNAVYPIERLLDAGVPIDALSEHNYPALHAAIEHGSPGALRYLLRCGACVHTYGNESGWTPLCHAVELAVLCFTDDVADMVQPSLDVVAALVSAGADPAVSAPPLRCSPLEYADTLEQNALTRAMGVRLHVVLGWPQMSE